MITSMKEELFNRLIWLTFNWKHNSQLSAQQKIGEELHQLGGLALMQEAFYDALDHNPQVYAINAYWDGVGEWLP